MSGMTLGFSRTAKSWPVASSDGFRHLYLQSADMKSAGRATEGDWEVTGHRLRGRGEEADLVRVERAQPAGTPALQRELRRLRQDARLTEGAGWHSDLDESRKCDLFIDSYSSLETPPVTSLHERRRQAVARFEGSGSRTILDKYEILKTEIVKFKEADGTAVLRPANQARQLRSLDTNTR